MTNNPPTNEPTVDWIKFIDDHWGDGMTIHLRIRDIQKHIQAQANEIKELEKEVDEMGAVTVNDCVLELQNQDIEDLKTQNKALLTALETIHRVATDGDKVKLPIIIKTAQSAIETAKGATGE